MANASTLARYEMMRRARNEANGRMEANGGDMRNTYGYGEMEMHRERWDEEEYPLEQRRNMPRRKDGTFKPRNEMYANYMGEREDAIEPNEREGGGRMIGFTDRMRNASDKGSKGKLTEAKAREWVQSMRSETSPPGEHWSIDQVKQLMSQNNIEHDPAEVYAIMNALYSDYNKVFKKYGLSDPRAVLEMAMAWLKDADAVENKAEMYYECIVKH